MNTTEKNNPPPMDEPQPTFVGIDISKDGMFVGRQADGVEFLFGDIKFGNR